MSLGRICRISISRRNVKAPATRGLRFAIRSERFGSRFVSLSVMRLSANVLGLWTFRPFDVSHPGRFAVYTITSAVLLSVCVKTRRKKLCMDLHDFCAETVRDTAEVTTEH